MQFFSRHLLFLFLFCSTSLVYADWDGRCLDTCFRTGHDCNYCNYQCYVDDAYPRVPNRTGNSVCPFDTYSYGNPEDYSDF